MGLAAIASEDPFTLWTSGNYPSIGGRPPLQTRQDFFYYDRLDYFWFAWSNSGLSINEQSIRVDPLFQQNTGTLFSPMVGVPNFPRTLPDSVGPTNANSVAPGEWNSRTNEQKVYPYTGFAGANFGHFAESTNPLTFAISDQNPFPNVGSSESRNGSGIGDPGYYTSPSGNWRFFESWGFAFCSNVRVYDSQGAAVDNVAALVDLASGNATIVDTPVRYSSSPTNQFQSTALFGQEVNFQYCQFVQDDNQIPSQPRGAMYLFSNWTTNPDDSNQFRVWVKIVDWNPFNLRGTPSRVHLRERLLSAVDLVKGSPALLNGVHETGPSRERPMLYHPRTNRIIVPSSDNQTGVLTANQVKFVFVSPTPAVTEITEPFSTEVIASGKTVTFAVEALGSLGEQIGGVDFRATLRQTSTVGESLAVTPAAGETVSLARSVYPLEPGISPVTVVKDGVRLSEGVEYDVNRSAGTITFNAPEPTDGIYTVSYQHLNTTVPGGGTNASLLNVFSTSGVDGLGIFRVAFDEESRVANRWYELETVQI